LGAPAFRPVNEPEQHTETLPLTRHHNIAKFCHNIKNIFAVTPSVKNIEVDCYVLLGQFCGRSRQDESFTPVVDFAAFAHEQNIGSDFFFYSQKRELTGSQFIRCGDMGCRILQRIPYSVAAGSSGFVENGRTAWLPAAATGAQQGARMCFETRFCADICPASTMRSPAGVRNFGLDHDVCWRPSRQNEYPAATANTSAHCPLSSRGSI
jgi:hypothetical protein